MKNNLSVFIIFMVFTGLMQISIAQTNSNSNIDSWICSTPIFTDSLSQIALENTKRLDPNTYQLMMNNLQDFTLKKTVVDTLGSIKNFFTYNFVTKSYNTVYAKLLSKGTRIQIWVDTTELANNHASQGVADTLLNSLENKTPAASRDSTKGIVRLDEQYFGNPPNKDGDNLTDFLIYDIKDGWNGNTVTTFTGGYFDPDDQKDIANSNKKDLLYIDSYPGIFSNGTRNATGPLSTLAHEYQHLIHYNYDKKEVTFVNEGLSEFASVISGYQLRSPSLFFEDTDISLFDWDNKSPSVLYDYSRAALFTLYYNEQFGDSVLKKVVQDTLTGIKGLDNVFSNYKSNLISVFQNFTVANYLNDRSVDTSYGYKYAITSKPLFSRVFNIPNFIIKDSVNSWGSNYIVYNSGGDTLDVEIQANDSIKVKAISIGNTKSVDSLANYYPYKFSNFGTAVQKIILPVVNIDSAKNIYTIRTHSQYKGSFWDQTNGPDPYGDKTYSQIETMAVDTSNRIFAGTRHNGIYLSPDEGASWTATSLTNWIFDIAINNAGDIFAATETGLYRSTDHGIGWSKLNVDPFYANYLANQVETDKNGNVYVSANTYYMYKSIDNGENWSQIISKPAINRISIDKDRGKIYAAEGQNIVSLSSDNGVTWQDVGDDSTLGLIETLYTSPYDGTLYAGTHSKGIYYFDSSKWVKIPFFENSEYNAIMGIVIDTLKNIYVGTATKGIYKTIDLGKTWQEVNYGISQFIRTFAVNKNMKIFVGSSSDGVFKKLDVVTGVKELRSQIPVKFYLSQNYPNPFNPSTVISYQLSALSKISIKVYDVLGREITTLVNQEQHAGNYIVNFDASKLSSGVYFYRIVAGNFVQTKKMVLIK